MTTYSAFIAPFVDYGFMRRALVACLALGLGSAPIGVLLMLRRMSLVGDAMSHAILPGAAVGFLVAGGLSLPAMGLGGLIAGLSVALLSGLISRTTALQRGCQLCEFLSDVIGARRSHCFVARLEHRSLARIVRHYPRYRRHGALSRWRHSLVHSRHVGVGL